MSNSKLKVLEQFPTARAVASPDGKLWRLDGIHGVFEVEAANEVRLWDDALRYSKKWPESQERYLVKVEYQEQFGKALK